MRGKALNTCCAIVEWFGFRTRNVEGRSFECLRRIGEYYAVGDHRIRCIRSLRLWTVLWRISGVCWRLWSSFCDRTVIFIMRAFFDRICVRICTFSSTQSFLIDLFGVIHDAEIRKTSMSCPIKVCTFLTELSFHVEILIFLATDAAIRCRPRGLFWAVVRIFIV